MLNLNDYLGGVADVEHKDLKKRLEDTQIEPMSPYNPDEAEKLKNTWSFIELNESYESMNGPFRLPAKNGLDDDKYLSMNASNVNFCGKESKLFVVRDLSPLVNMQSTNYSKQLFGTFTEKVLLQVQESSLRMIKTLSEVRDKETTPKESQTQLD